MIIYHLNWDTAERRLPVIKMFDKVFKPLHKQLATIATTDIKFLTAVMMIQSTYFADGPQIIANFSNRSKIIVK